MTLYPRPCALLRVTRMPKLHAPITLLISRFLFGECLPLVLLQELDRADFSNCPLLLFHHGRLGDFFKGFLFLFLITNRSIAEMDCKPTLTKAAFGNSLWRSCTTLRPGVVWRYRVRSALIGFQMQPALEQHVSSRSSDCWELFLVDCEEPSVKFE